MRPFRPFPPADCVEEETNAASCLPANHSRLMVAISSSEQQTRRRTWRPYHDPTLGASVTRDSRGVLHELEAQCVHEEADRRVVLVDHDGDKAEMHHGSIDRLYRKTRKPSAHFES